MLFFKITNLSDNVDYDDIKRMIKKHTTPGSGQAVSIPGQGGEIEKNFEDALYSILLEQHQRIDLFVRSKTGEIQRRLGELGPQPVHITQLTKYLNRSPYESDQTIEQLPPRRQNYQSYGETSRAIQ